jgi:serine/threonine protein kinase
MGSVYLAEQRSPRRQVALKVIRRERLGDPGAHDRFRREARAVAALRDPGICTLLEVGEVDGAPFLAMQYIAGETLAERLAAQRAGPPGGSAGSGPGTPADIHGVLSVIEKVARSLHVAHEAGVVHRDVKPGNVMIDAKGEPIVLDFGLARVAADAADASLTRTGDVLGTPAYMSPEQVRPGRHAIDRRTDVYSLAAMLFECLTLERPFSGSSEVALQERILRDPTPDPRRHNPHVPADVGAVIGKAMEKEPERRYATAAEFADELARLRRREPVLARHIGALAPPRPVGGRTVEFWRD